MTDAAAERDAAIAQVARHAGDAFLEMACQFVTDYLLAHGETPGEDLTFACIQAGIAPHDDRAFGHVYRSLARRGTIQKCGVVPRKRGHLTSGGNVWRLTPQQGDVCTKP